MPAASSRSRQTLEAATFLLILVAIGVTPVIAYLIGFAVGRLS